MQWHLQNTEQVISEYGQSTSVAGVCGVDIDAVRGWQRTRGSPDVWMAIFDSGIELDNPEFEGRLAPEEAWISLSCAAIGSGSPVVASTCCCNGGDCNYGSAHDVTGHGTWVAGTAAANHDGEGGLGVDPGCTILPVRVVADDDGILARSIIALEMIDSNNGANELYENVRAINMSYLAASALIDDGQTTAFRDALESLREEGVIIVVISGNAETGQELADVLLPSASPDVISVGATDNQDRRLDSSAVPTTVNSGRGDQLDFVAPGFAILTAVCENQDLTSCNVHCLYGNFSPPLSGTSGAAPQVTGIVTLLIARANVLSIELDFNDIYTLLSAGAVKLGTSATQHDKSYGWGRVSLYGSLMALEAMYECDADITHTDDSAEFGYGVPDGKVDADDTTAFFDLYNAANLIADLTTTGYTTPGGGGLNGTPDGILHSDDVVYFLAFYSNCSSLPCPACPP